MFKTTIRLFATVLALLSASDWCTAQNVSFIRLSGVGDIATSPLEDGIVCVADTIRHSEYLYSIDGATPSSGILTVGPDFASVVPTTIGEYSLANPLVITRNGELSFAFAALPTELKDTEFESLAADMWVSSNASWQAGRFGWGWQESLGEFPAVSVLIPIVGIENLANASNTTLVTGTVIASVPIAIGIVAGGEVVLGVGTVGTIATGSGSVAVATGVTVTEGAAATSTIVVVTGGTTVGTGTAIVSTTGPSAIAAGSTVFPTTAIVTGSQTVVFGHGSLHLVGTALSQAPVEAAIACAASEVAATGVTSGISTVVVNGVAIEFRMHIIDGIIRIGTYFAL